MLSWRLSNTMEADFCIEALHAAVDRAQCVPLIFNNDQGSQFTSQPFTGALKKLGVAISMDGRGRYLDNIFIERLWRSYKTEEVYLHDYEGVSQLYRGTDQWFDFYNNERPHRSLRRRTPSELMWTPKLLPVVKVDFLGPEGQENPLKCRKRNDAASVQPSKPRLVLKG